MERTGLLQLAGKDATIIGPDISVGQTAPEFTVQNQEWQFLNGLETTKGNVRILAAVPSLETSVCDTETRRFNEEASKLGNDIVIVTISADLPYTQKRWCGAAGVERVLVVSDHYSVDFGEKYGCLIKERRILRRAVFVVGKDDNVVYSAYMPQLGVEPDYADVLDAARKALG